MRRGADEGFTVIELMIAMLIMLIILVPLVASFVVGTQVALGSQQDVNNSADAQLLGYFFDIDVASAATVSPTSGGCGGSGSVLELSWTDGGSQVVAYRAVADAARQSELQQTTPVYRLERVLCNAAGIKVTVIARSLMSLPTAKCDAATCGAASTPRRVALSISELSTQESDVGSTNRFTVGVTAVRKVTP
jgi:prepilin-type N-terminal cleavage/methylation domain-containing protein